jgi:hypothetical protein
MYDDDVITRSMDIMSMVIIIDDICETHVMTSSSLFQTMMMLSVDNPFENIRGII